MEDFCVLRIKGKQYLVKKGEEFLVDKYDDKDGAEVLMRVKNSKVEVGKPTLDSRNLKIKVVESVVKGKKVTTLKYKSKSRYRKKIGFRPLLTKLLIENF